jgi:hypothetical protein
MVCYPPPHKCEWLLTVLREPCVETFVYIGEFAGDTGTAALEAELYCNFELMAEAPLPNFINTVYSLTIWRKRKLDKIEKWPLFCQTCKQIPSFGEKFYRDRIVRRLVFCGKCSKSKDML